MKITRLILATFILCGCNDEHLSPVDKLCHENGYQHHYWTQSGLLVCENRGYSYPNMTHEIKLARDNCRALNKLAAPKWHEDGSMMCVDENGNEIQTTTK